jgi:hypothetical protein
VNNVQPDDPNIHFSVMEALYAHGYTSIQSVQNHTLADFKQALTGTIAYTCASQIVQNAQIAGQSTPPSTGTFQPINPGCLVNCVPPPYLSPLGPVAYLHELLKLSVNSTCENP